MLNKEQEGDNSLGAKISEDSTAAEILVLFLVEQKKDILRKRNSLIKATYEFYFQERPEKNKDIFRKDFDSSSVQIL